MAGGFLFIYGHCHSAAKFISKIVPQETIVRDDSHYSHFSLRFFHKKLLLEMPTATITSRMGSTSVDTAGNSM